ncbi:Aste57867_11856 [Aphanomyces stellatus]|uniref:Aste57867_11856 protein n=1 Tax=Aphanomyces stellatus TaxID=120398 RepID=A0A485KUP6_9STRA|nr:hypothetical protein As57867_011811 [Aphanomyces stellatus]VFT88711.1 Aste57867_11856 [Aphanomyces stellatus]
MSLPSSSPPSSKKQASATMLPKSKKRMSKDKALPPAVVVNVLSSEEEERLLAVKLAQDAELLRQRIAFDEQEARGAMLVAEVDSTMALPVDVTVSTQEHAHRVATSLYLAVACNAGDQDGTWGYHGASVLCLVVVTLHGHADLGCYTHSFVKTFLQWRDMGLLSATAGRLPPLSLYQTVALRRLKEIAGNLTAPPLPLAQDPPLPVDESLPQALATVVLHAEAPKLAMEAALAIASLTNHAEETRDVVRYMTMLVLGIVQGAPKPKLVQPYFVAAGFPLDYWQTSPPSPPLRRVVSRLPHTRLCEGSYVPNAHAITTFEVVVWIFNTAENLRHGLTLVEQVAHPHTAAASLGGLLLGAYYSNKDVPLHRPLILAPLVQTLLAHACVYALRMLPFQRSLTHALETTWTIYTRATRSFHAIAVKARATAAAIDPRSPEDDVASAQSLAFATPTEMAAEATEFWTAYIDLVASLVPVVPVVLKPKEPDLVGGRVESLKATRSGSEEQMAAGIGGGAGALSPPRPSNASRGSSRQGRKPRSKKPPPPTAEEIRRNELKIELADRYMCVRDAIKTHFATALEALAKELDEAVIRDAAIEAWTARAALADTLASNQHQLQMLEAKMAAEGGGGPYPSKAHASDMCKFSRLATLKHTDLSGKIFDAN